MALMFAVGFWLSIDAAVLGTQDGDPAQDRLSNTRTTSGDTITRAPFQQAPSAYIPTDDRSNTVLTAILERARADAVTASDIAIQRETAAANTTLRKAVIAAKFGGSYPAIKRLVADLQGQFQFVALEAFSARRAQAPDTIEANVRLSVFYRVVDRS